MLFECSFVLFVCFDHAAAAVVIVAVGSLSYALFSNGLFIFPKLTVN